MIESNSHVSCWSLPVISWMVSDHEMQGRAPWPLSAENSVDEQDNWKVEHTYGYVNNYHPDLLVMLQCNHDIKLLTNGEDTRNLMWYISNYATKGQKKCLQHVIIDHQICCISIFR